MDGTGGQPQGEGMPTWQGILINQKTQAEIIFQQGYFRLLTEQVISGVNTMSHPFTFNPISAANARKYCEDLESAKRMGSAFFRSMFGVETRQEAYSLPTDILESFFRVGLHPLSVELMRRKSIAAEDVIKDIRRHIENAFPTLKRVGLVIRSNASAAPTKAFSGCPCVSVTWDTAKGETYSLSWAWEVKTERDITDKTEIVKGSEDISLPSQGPMEYPRETATHPRDTTYTWQAVHDSNKRNFSNGLAIMRDLQTGINPVGLTLTMANDVIACLFPVAVPVAVPAAVPAAVHAAVPVTHKGLTINQIDALIRRLDVDQSFKVPHTRKRAKVS
jgi:hypothetical protein